MDRTAMLETAKKFWQSRDVKPTPITMADFALSLLQWKRIDRKEENLPKENGEYNVRSYGRTQVFAYDKNEGTVVAYWLTQITAYVPIPIPQFKEGEDDT